MRVLVLSDIHGNLPALEEVLSNAGSFEATWCLGDLVGYGPNPNECIDRIRSLPEMRCVLGNHDAAALGLIDVDTFNTDARKALLWTQNQLTPKSKRFLESLPETVVSDAITLTHGSPRHPIWEYLIDERTATQNFEFFQTEYCLVGHTHLPVYFYLAEGKRQANVMLPKNGANLSLKPRMILNPGSVGQPRDRDPRASYAILDTKDRTWTVRRVEYSIGEVQEQMRLAGLPQRHIDRLEVGW